jgi:hypothetical protein
LSAIPAGPLNFLFDPWHRHPPRKPEIADIHQGIMIEGHVLEMYVEGISEGIPFIAQGLGSQEKGLEFGYSVFRHRDSPYRKCRTCQE